MTAAPPLPCQGDPERWFVRDSHIDALAGCLRCPARRWCAREALRCKASWGLWAGIWIDGRHGDAEPRLAAIATDDPVQMAVARPADEAHARDEVAALRRPTGASRARSARTAVLARSCGHCEVVAAGCRYSFDRLVRRRSPGRECETATPPALFAACTSCAETVAALDPALGRRRGYTVDSGRDPARVPFLWRACRWVLLDRDGWLTEISERAGEVAV